MSLGLISSILFFHLHGLQKLQLRDHIGVDDSFEKDFKEKYDVFFPVTDISSVGLGETICFEGKQAILLGYATTPNGSYAYGNYIK